MNDPTNHMERLNSHKEVNFFIHSIVPIAWFQEFQI